MTLCSYRRTDRLVTACHCLTYLAVGARSCSTFGVNPYIVPGRDLVAPKGSARLIAKRLALPCLVIAYISPAILKHVAQVDPETSSGLDPRPPKVELNAMYPTAYTSPPPSSSPYTSPPLGSAAPDPYRANAIRQPYSTAFSPPPVPPAMGASGYAPMPPAQAARFQQYARQSPPIGGAGLNPQAQAQAQAQAQSRSGTSSRQRLPGSGPNGYAPQAQTQLPAQTPRYKGTLPPGQIVTVGDHTVKVERYLSEGGYAHVYLTSSDRPIYPPSKSGAGDKRGRWGEKGFTEHCLKRIAFEDDSVWTDVKKEIEVMVGPAIEALISHNHLRFSRRL